MPNNNNQLIRKNITIQGKTPLHKAVIKSQITAVTKILKGPKPQIN